MLAQKADALAITHVTVIDCTGAAPKPNSTVLIAAGRIAAVGPADRISISQEVRVVDGTGKFLIPGLWDMHGHLTDATEDAFPLLIMNGVTGVRDMGGDLAQIDRWRSEIEKGTRVGPHIIRAGPFVDGPKPGVSNRLTVRTPEEARQAVHDLKAKGVDFIKVHNALPPDAFFALMEEARREHIPVAVHLPQGVSSAEASDAGAASLEHTETLAESALWRKGATAKTVEQAVDENLGPAGQELFQRFVKNGTWYDGSVTQLPRALLVFRISLLDSKRKPGVERCAPGGGLLAVNREEPYHQPKLCFRDRARAAIAARWCIPLHQPCAAIHAISQPISSTWRISLS